MCENVVEVSEHSRCLLEQKSLLNALSETQLKGQELGVRMYQHSVWINQACGLRQ